MTTAFRILITTLLCLTGGLLTAGAADMSMINAADSVAKPTDPTPAETTVESADSLSIREAIHDTWSHFKQTNKVEINDSVFSRVKYPKFIKMCMAVYDWVDSNFNSYDTAYVAGTGKNGKVRLVSDNWTDVHSFHVKELQPLVMVSSPYSNLGIQANYSILSVGFSIDMNALISGKKSHHKKTQFGISTARVLLESFYWRTSGATVIRRYGEVNSNPMPDIKFEGQRSKSFGLRGYYIFNYKKYSHAAAYNLSNYQLKSAGSWIAGLSGSFYDCSFDFTTLPQEVLDKINFPFDYYRFDYNSINIRGGYGFNWVINKHWLFNTTTLPGMGIGISFSRATRAHRVDLSIVGRQLNSLTYTTRQFFVSAASYFQANFLISKEISFMSGIGNLQVSTGVRF